MSDPDQVVDLKEEDKKQTEKPARTHMGFLPLGSAIFGGIAVALWNRRTLAKMQNRSEESPGNILPLEDDAIY